MNFKVISIEDAELLMDKTLYNKAEEAFYWPLAATDDWAESYKSDSGPFTFAVVRKAPISNDDCGPFVEAYKIDASVSSLEELTEEQSAKMQLYYKEAFYRYGVELAGINLLRLYISIWLGLTKDEKDYQNVKEACERNIMEIVKQLIRSSNSMYGYYYAVIVNVLFEKITPDKAKDELKRLAEFNIYAWYTFKESYSDKEVE